MGVCTKRKTYNFDFIPSSTIQEPSSKRRAVSKSIIFSNRSIVAVGLGSLKPSKRCLVLGLGSRGSGSRDAHWMFNRTMAAFPEIFCCQNNFRGHLCLAEMLLGLVVLIKEPVWETKFQMLLLWNLIPLLELFSWRCNPEFMIATSPRMNFVERTMDGDAACSERKGEEGTNKKHSSTEASDRKDSKGTGSSQESNGEDNGEAGEDNTRKKTTENRRENNGEGDEEGKDDDKLEREEDEAEEEEDIEEEGKGEADTEVDSEFHMVSTLRGDQVLDLSTLSDCRSHHSDDMYHGQEGLSSLQSRYQDFMAFKPQGPNGEPKGDTDMHASDYSASHLPMSDGSASNKMHVDSPCLQTSFHDTSVDRRAASDMSRDLYSNEMTCSRPLASSLESPSLQRVSDGAGWQTPSDVSKDLYTDGSASHNWQPTTLTSPALPQSVADVVQQTSSGASRDSVSLDQVSEPEHMKLELNVPAAEKMNMDLPSTFEDGTGEEVLSKLKEVKEVPATAKGLLSSGALDGHSVYYHYRGSGSILTGLVKDGGILCNCRLCKGNVVVNVSSFEKHAGSNARHPSDHIFLEDGKSLQDIIKILAQPSQAKVTGVVRKAANEGAYDRTGTRSSATRSVSGFSRRGTLSSSDPSRVESLHARSSQKQSAQTRDGSRHKLLFQPGGLPDGTEVAYYVKGQCFLKGTKKGHGICCGCCNEVVSCSQFEAHAGWASRRNAYISMYLSNGQSLHEYALTLEVKDPNSTDSNSLRENDDFCAECGDGGDLVLCDTCPKAYHSDCAGLAGIPRGDWRCPLCEAKKQCPWKHYGKDSGRVFHWNNKDTSAERCHRVVKAPENTIGGCVFCKNGDFQKSGFGPKTIMLCDQCEREFHVGCMKEKGIADLKELPAGEWFCCRDCKHIHNVLEELVIRGPELVRPLSVLRKQPVVSKSGDLAWQLLHGRRGNPATGRTLAKAASIFTESFDPIVDATSGRDLISLMVYSRTIRDQDFRGMYCAVLKQREEVISAAVFRISGRQFAEMPLVATASAHRGQGYFQLLMSCIEELLRRLQIKYFILPAAEGAEGIWTNKFGFSKLLEEQLRQFGSEVQMMIFQGSSMLFKVIE